MLQRETELKATIWKTKQCQMLKSDDKGILVNAELTLKTVQLPVLLYVGVK